MNRGSATVWLVLSSAAALIVLCLGVVISFGVSKAVEQGIHRDDSIIECVKLGNLPGVCEEALRP